MDTSGASHSALINWNKVKHRNNHYNTNRCCLLIRSGHSYRLNRRLDFDAVRRSTQSTTESYWSIYPASPPCTIQGWWVLPAWTVTNATLKHCLLSQSVYYQGKYVDHFQGIVRTDLCLSRHKLPQSAHNYGTFTHMDWTAIHKLSATQLPEENQGPARASLLKHSPTLSISTGRCGGKVELTIRGWITECITVTGVVLKEWRKGSPTWDDINRNTRNRTLRQVIAV